VTDGCFYGDGGMFRVAPPLELKKLEGIFRASFFQERMQYLDQEGTVVYRSKDGETTKSFPALEWLAAMCSRIPNRGEQRVR